MDHIMLFPTFKQVIDFLSILASIWLMNMFKWELLVQSAFRPEIHIKVKPLIQIN